MPSKDETMLVKTAESKDMKPNTAFCDRVQPWKAFLNPINGDTALAETGADDMVYQLKSGIQDDGNAS